MKISHKSFQLSIIKTLFLVTIAFIEFIVIGCNSTAYLSLTKNNKEQIERKLYDYSQDKKVGAEVTISFKNGTAINGELLSVQDTIMILCINHSATEEELSNFTYPVIPVRNDEIRKLAIKGSNCIWIGSAIGSVTFTGVGIWIGHEYERGLDAEGAKVGFGIIGFLTGAIIGGIAGYLLSTDDIILQDIPPRYDFSFLKSFTRYRDEEPEYLRVIK